MNLNRSQNWPPARSYEHAREIAIGLDIKVQRPVVWGRNAKDFPSPSDKD